MLGIVQSLQRDDAGEKGSALISDTSKIEDDEVIMCTPQKR